MTKRLKPDVDYLRRLINDDEVLEKLLRYYDVTPKRVKGRPRPVERIAAQWTLIDQAEERIERDPGLTFKQALRAVVQEEWVALSRSAFLATWGGGLAATDVKARANVVNRLLAQALKKNNPGDRVTLGNYYEKLGKREPRGNRKPRN